MMCGYGMMAGFGWPGRLLTALFWAGVIVLAIWAFSKLFAAQSGGGEGDALEILRRRYARGEISREEFEQARETLRA